MAKFDLHKTQGLNNVMNAIQQVKNVNNIIPLTEARELSLENLYPSSENFYSVEELDDLTESVRELGILQPLLVSERSSGVYEIIAGNRRYEAARTAGLKKLPCIVKQNVEPNMFKIMLIHANLFRVKSDIERATEVAELKKAIHALKHTDKSIKGRTSEIAGQILNLSYRQVNRLDNLNKLIPEIQGLVQQGKLTASCAEQFAGMEESAQKEIYEALINSGMDINRNEAAQLRESFLAKSRDLAAQAEADQARLLAKLQEKEQELAGLAGQATPAELKKVKKALVSALQDRKDIEARYDQLSQMVETRTGEAASADVEKMISDVKRRVHLQTCIDQLKLAARTYTAYKDLYRAAGSVPPSDPEVDLLNELICGVRALSRQVMAE